MTERRKYLILMSAILAAVAGAVMLAVPGSPIHRKPTLGLDLQGGLEVILKAVPPKGQQLTADDLTRSIDIMQSRVDKIGVASPEIRKQGSDQIVIQLAGVHDPAKAADLIGKTAQLQLFDLQADVTGPSAGLNGAVVATPTLYGLLTQVQAQAAKGVPQAYYLFRNTTVRALQAKPKNTATTPTVKHSLLQGPTDTLQQLLAPYNGKMPKSSQVLKAPANTIVVSCPATTGCPGATAPTGTFYYLMKYFPDRKTGAGPIPELTGGDLVLSGTRADFGPNGLPIVTLQFTNHGAK
ncbi:MAG TPA: hypothetical protein VM690_08840, partial [Gaiellaceae bacterium]|nr:hypothetical protein [Gaiellaceae bacterium]